MLTYREPTPTNTTALGSLEMLKIFKYQPSVRLRLGSSRGKSGHGQKRGETAKSPERGELAARKQNLGLTT